MFEHGDASYLDETIDQCSFYGRDWDRDEEPALKTYRDEWMYMYNMSRRKHDFAQNTFIYSKIIDGMYQPLEYVSDKIIKNSYNSVSYWTKFEPVSLNKEYIKYKGKHEKHAEVKMIGCK